MPTVLNELYLEPNVLMIHYFLRNKNLESQLIKIKQHRINVDVILF